MSWCLSSMTSSSGAAWVIACTPRLSAGRKPRCEAGSAAGTAGGARSGEGGSAPAALQVPEQGPLALAHPHAESQVKELAAQTPSIPFARPQMDGAIGEPAIAVVAPILARQSGKIEHAAREPAEIDNRPPGGAIVQILQDVVADDETVGGGRSLTAPGPKGPAEPRAKVLARTGPRVPAPRQTFRKRFGRSP